MLGPWRRAEPAVPSPVRSGTRMARPYPVVRFADACRSADCVRADANRTGPSVQQGYGVDAAMVRARRLQRRHRWPGTRVRPRAHEAPRLGTPPRATKWALKRLKENSHESCQIAGTRWAIGVQRCTNADHRTRRDLGE